MTPVKPAVDWITARLWPTKHSIRVWAILDGARDEQIYQMVLGYGGEKCCLYAGTLHPELERAAPHLVRLEDAHDPFVRELISRSWGESWGVYFQAETTLAEVRKHLRTLLRVNDEAGRKLVFRYYDPRVLRAFLPTCDPSQLKQMFGPGKRFVMEGEDPRTVIQYKFDSGKLLTDRATAD